MQIELDLDMRTVRMIKALGALTGKPSSEISSIVSELIQDGLKAKIAQEIGLDDVVPQFEAVPKTTPVQKRPAVDFSDATGISDGLGDVDTEEVPEPAPPAPLKKADALVPQTGGIKDEDLDRDMEVDDPKHESKAESTFGETYFVQKQGRAEDLFAEVAGLPKSGHIAHEEEAMPAPRKRRVNPNARRAKVTPLTHEPRDV